MSIKAAASFARKMQKENQHTWFRCCRIAADYYGVSVDDVQREISSRGGLSRKGEKMKIYVYDGWFKYYLYPDWQEVSITVKSYNRESALTRVRNEIVKRIYIDFPDHDFGGVPNPDIYSKYLKCTSSL